MVTDVWLGIDGTNWVHALWHALRGVDVLTHVARRARILTAYTRASRVLICFDRRSFRHDLYVGYKANRAAKEQTLRQLLDDAPAALASAGQQPVYQDGYEADDCLATLAAAAFGAGCKCVLATADKDLWQCLREGWVSVLRSFGTHGSELICPEWQTALELEIAPKTLGLKPSCWADYQCLVGESGDNVPGCPGWGEQTARRGLANAGSIEAMLRDPWAIHCSKSQLTKLQNWARADNGLKLTRQLITLRTDVPAVLDAVR
jgi:DNA polymerase-1